MRVTAHIVALVVIMSALGCGSSNENSCYDPERRTCEPSTRSWIDPAGSSHQYVVDSIRFPYGAEQANEYGLSLDNDELCRVDNAAGIIFGAAFGLLADDIDATMLELIRSGTILHLIEVRATDLSNAPGTGVTVLTGMDADSDPANNLDGAGQFVVDTSHPSVELGGDIRNGRLRASLGAVPLQIAFSDVVPPVVVTLNAAAVDVEVTETSIEGRLAGSFTEQQFNDEVLPIAWALLNSLVEQDCSGTVPACCTEDSDGATVVGLFDNDPEDCQVTLEEVRNSNLVKSLLGPDVDLYDSQGRHNPLCDEQKDSLSFGLWFTAVPASF